MDIFSNILKYVSKKVGQHSWANGP